MKFCHTEWNLGTSYNLGWVSTITTRFSFVSCQIVQQCFLTSLSPAPCIKFRKVFLFFLVCCKIFVIVGIKALLHCCVAEKWHSVWKIIFLVYLPGSKFAITSLSELNVFVFDKIKSNLLLQLFEVATFPRRLLYQPWLLLCPFPLLFLPLTCRGAGVCWPWVVSCGSYLHRPFHLLRVPLAVKNWGGYELYGQPGKTNSRNKIKRTQRCVRHQFRFLSKQL